MEISEKQETNSVGDRRGLSEKSLANLRPGGGGRPKGSVSLTTALRRKLEQEDADSIINNLIDLALAKPESKQRLGKDGEHYYDMIDGNEVKLHQWAVDLIVERIDGKTPERYEHTEVPADLAEFDTNDLQAFRDWLKERKTAQP